MSRRPAQPSLRCCLVLSAMVSAFSLLLQSGGVELDPANIVRRRFRVAGASYLLWRRDSNYRQFRILIQPLVNLDMAVRESKTATPTVDGEIGRASCRE